MKKQNFKQLITNLEEILKEIEKNNSWADVTITFQNGEAKLIKISDTIKLK